MILNACQHLQNSQTTVVSNAHVSLQNPLGEHTWKCSGLTHGSAFRDDRLGMDPGLMHKKQISSLLFCCSVFRILGVKRSQLSSSFAPWIVNGSRMGDGMGIVRMDLAFT